MERPRVLVTGAFGFAGSHLMGHLRELGFPAEPSAVRLPARDSFARQVAGFRPDAVVHLAALSFLPAAESDPRKAIDANVDGVRSVAEGLRLADPAGRVRLVIVSTGQVYRAGGGRPLDEDSPLDPASAYARTKLAGELLARTLCDAEPPRPLWVFRPFNHTGPGQRPQFAAPSFARQVALMEAGKAERVLHTGDLEVRRDFCDVRDVVRAYARAAAGVPPPGVYNLASGRSVSLREIADHYRSRTGIAFELWPRTEAGRAGEVKEMRGSAERIFRASGWKAEIPLERTLDDLLAEWRTRVASGEEAG